MLFSVAESCNSAFSDMLAAGEIGIKETLTLIAECLLNQTKDFVK